MQKVPQSLIGTVNKEAFRRLPNQPRTDHAIAAKNRIERLLPDDVFQSTAVFGLSAPIEGAPSISEMARALRYDVDLIYQFIHDNIDNYPNYGLHKGGWGTLVDSCGNAFDQSDLMVQLLRESGYTANYVLGNVTLSAAQWSNLLNINTNDIEYAAQLFSNGGFAVSTDVPNNTITIDYCWVECFIDGTSYKFDPALKNYTYVTGIDLATAMSYNRSTFLSDAQSGSTITTDYLQNINQPNIAANLTDYAMNLVDWIETNNSGASFNEIVGGRTIVPVSGQVRNTSLPYQSGSPTTYAAIPDGEKAKIRIEYSTIAQEFFTNDIYGYRISLFWNASRQAQLYLNLPGESGNIVATSSAQTLGNTYPMTVEVTHPYASTFADDSNVFNLQAGAKYAIGTAWGYSGRQMSEVHRVALAKRMQAGGTAANEDFLGESLSIVWWNFSGQNATGTQIINQLSGTHTTFHHNIGTVGYYPTSVFTPGDYIYCNFSFNHWNTSALNDSANVDASSANYALFWHTLEAATLTQGPGVVAAGPPAVVTSANGGFCNATITGTVTVGNVLNIFIHDSRLSTNPAQISYTTVLGDTTTSIATKLALAINNSSTLGAIGVTATSSTNVLRIGSYSYNNTTFTQSVTVGSETITLVVTPGMKIYSGNKLNWLSTVRPALTTGGYDSALLDNIGSYVAYRAFATIDGTVASGGGDVLTVYIHDSALGTNPTPITITTVAGDTTTSIALKFAQQINASSALAAIGLTATYLDNVLWIFSLSVNTTSYTQSVTVGSETISLPNTTMAAISGAVSAGGGDVLNIFVHNSALSTNPTPISYTTVAGDTLTTITNELTALINGSSALAAIKVTAESQANVITINSESTSETTYTQSVTTGSETISLNFNPGFSVYFPNNDDVIVSNFYQGYGFYMLSPQGDVVFTPLSNTGKGARSGTISVSDCNEGCSENSPDFFGLGFAQLAQSLSAEPIDLFKGAYIYSDTDISVGNQSEPYELSFVRSYNSNNSINDDGLGFGWNHNYQISAMINSDGFIGLGYQSVSAATAAIAQLFVCQDILVSTTPSSTAPNMVSLAITQDWLVRQLTKNTVIVQFGSEFQVFARIPNGSYLPQLGVKNSTSLSYSSTFVYKTPDQVTYSFNTSGKVASISYPFGITVSLVYTGALLTQVNNGFRTLTLNYSSNKLSSVSDGLGRSVSYTIDAANNLTMITDPLTYSSIYSYDTPGKLTSIYQPANPNLAVVTNFYDSLGRVMKQLDAYDNPWTYFFAGSRSEEVDPEGNSTIRYFNAFGNVVQFTNQLGGTTFTEYDGRQRSTLVTLPEGNGTAYTYDTFDNVLSITAFAKSGSGLSNVVCTFAYDLLWNKISTAVDGNGNTTIYTYDSITGQLTQIQLPAVSAGTAYTFFTYNTIGQILSITDPTGIVTSFIYDSSSKDLLTQTIDSSSGHLNLTTTFTYDSVGNFTTIEDANSNTTSMQFDLNRRLTQVTDPANCITSYDYDENSNLIRIQSQLANSIQQYSVAAYSASYTLDNLVSSITEPTINNDRQQPKANIYSYDKLRRRSKSTDSLGNTYSFSYDAIGRLYQATFPNGVIGSTLAYTVNGLLESIFDGAGNETQYVYDGFDRLDTTTYADATFESYQYDDNDNVTQITTRNANTIALTFDALNQVLTRAPQGQATVSYTYDLAGRLTSASVPVISGDPSTGVFQLQYDTAGRFFNEVYPSGLAVTLGLDNNGNVTSITYPDTTTVTRTYDQLDRLNSIANASGSVLFAYDPLSHQTSQVSGNGIVCGRSYDLSDNLLSMLFNTAQPLKFGFRYDGAHNEIDKQVSDNSYLWLPSAGSTSYGAANNLNQYPNVAASALTYNNAGCLIGDGTLTYSYNTENQLTSVTGSGVSVSYKYDPLGRQILKTVGASSIQFIYSGLQRIADYDLAGTLINKFYNTDALDESVWTESSGVLTYLHSDNTGSVIMTSNSSGVVVAGAPYSPWGESGSVNSFNIGFLGLRYDPEVGLYFCRERYYSPSLGRFLQPDPIGYNGDSLNLYEYALSDPLNFTDPLGLSSAGGDDEFQLSTVDKFLSGLPSPNEAVFGNYLPGFFDSYTFGGTQLARKLAGALGWGTDEGVVDPNSAAYQRGELLSYIAPYPIPGANAAKGVILQARGIYIYRIVSSSARRTAYYIGKTIDETGRYATNFRTSKRFSFVYQFGKKAPKGSIVDRHLEQYAMDYAKNVCKKQLPNNANRAVSLKNMAKAEAAAKKFFGAAYPKVIKDLEKAVRNYR